ncbi:MAG: hypothetical protein IJS15_02125 [Victivallales bacterium]|nr:hypothetical protein [Victivallales bacterium]
MAVYATKQHRLAVDEQVAALDLDVAEADLEALRLNERLAVIERHEQRV